MGCGRKELAAILAAFMLSLAGTQAAATTYDLSADWSDVQNPFGVWSLRKSPTELFAVNLPDYWGSGSNQRAWADQPERPAADTHVPQWMRVTTLQSGIADPEFDQQLSQVSIGDILMHGAEFDRTGTNVTSVVFTSPSASEFIVSGAIWQVWNSYRRMTWQLRLNDAVMSTGTIFADGTYWQGNPFDLAAGTGGPAALGYRLGAGDQIALVFISDSLSGNLGDRLGMRFSVSTVPEPGTLALFGLGLAGIGLSRRRKAA